MTVFYTKIASAFFHLPAPSDCSPLHRVGFRCALDPFGGSWQSVGDIGGGHEAEVSLAVSGILRADLQHWAGGSDLLLFNFCFMGV